MNSSANFDSNTKSPDVTTAHQRRIAALVEQACRLIESAEMPPSLDELAAQAGMSPFHFHRVFKAETGLTPKVYASAWRASKLRQKLNAADTITDAIYEAGFSSSSRFYETAEARLGMRPKDYRSGGQNSRIHFAVGQCSLGAILVAQSERGICAIFMGDDPDMLTQALQDQFPKAHFIGADSDFEQLVAQVVGFIEMPALGLNLPWMSKALHFRSGSGKPCARFRQAPQSAIANWPKSWAPPRPCALWPVPAQPTVLLSLFPAIASCVVMAIFRGIAGAWTASANYCSAKR